MVAQATATPAATGRRHDKGYVASAAVGVIWGGEPTAEIKIVTCPLYSPHQAVPRENPISWIGTEWCHGLGSSRWFCYKTGSEPTSRTNEESDEQKTTDDAKRSVR